MQTRIDEIAKDVYRLSSFVAEAPPSGFMFNQFLLTADEPLLFHCGPRWLFPSVSAAVAKVMPLERLRWITFGHVEADECGSVNAWLAAAPDSVVAHGATACMVSLTDMADRPPRPLADGEALDLGGRRVRYIDTPHVPHGWEAGLLFDETTNTLLCGDLFTQIGAAPPLTDGDIVGPAAAAEDLFGATCITARTAPTIRRLAALSPRTLALMHGPSYEGDGAAALSALADDYARRLRAEIDQYPQ